MRLLFVFFFLCSCATRNNVLNQYREKLQNGLAHKSQRTHILFLVDGLSYTVMKQQLKNGSLPNIKTFFLAPGQVLRKAHAVFPSLTFTNIAGILKEKPVHQTNAIGNKIVYNNRRINFESLDDRQNFTEIMRANNIFTRLNQKNYLTASFDYGLAADASLSSELDFQSAYAASQSDYRYIDLKKNDALKLLLSTTKTNQWPEFIFVHLVGYDFLSHRFGPQSAETLSYLKTIDSDLADTLNLLKKTESEHQVISILSADHGFSLNAKNYVDIGQLVKKTAPGAVVINESRMASLYYEKPSSTGELDTLTKKLIKQKGIELIAYKKSGQIKLQTHGRSFTYQELNQECVGGGVKISTENFTDICSTQLPESIKNMFYPFFIENLASYFSNPHWPDVVIIPNADTTFTNVGRGFHGGPTADETITPLLMRNAKIPQDVIIPNWQLLNFIN